MQAVKIFQLYALSGSLKCLVVKLVAELVALEPELVALDAELGAVEPKPVVFDVPGARFLKLCQQIPFNHFLSFSNFHLNSQVTHLLHLSGAFGRATISAAEQQLFSIALGSPLWNRDVFHHRKDPTSQFIGLLVHPQCKIQCFACDKHMLFRMYRSKVVFMMVRSQGDVDQCLPNNDIGCACDRSPGDYVVNIF